jgi:hypothetical protein
MIAMLRKLLAAACIAACAMPAAAASLDGRILAPDGSPAARHDVLLLTGEGELVASATTSEAGEYGFGPLADGSYRLGVRDPEGTISPVLGPETRIAGDERVRRDVRLVEGTGVRFAPAAYGPRSNTWWSRQTRNQKIFYSIGFVVGGIGLFLLADELLGDDDEDETPASPYYP